MSSDSSGSSPDNAYDERAGRAGQGSDDSATLTEPGRWRISPVWIIPLAALLIGGWLLYQNVVSQGPVVTLNMDTAEGIEAGSTQVKVRSVEVGHVTKVRLASDYQGAVVTVQMDPDTAELLGDESHFWIVKPRVGPQGISGLNTILSGAYLQLRPGKQASYKRQFKVSDNPPATPSDQPGVTVKLASSGDNSLSVGDPIVYLGQNVGQIESANFSVPKREMIYTIFINKPYSELVTGATQFWLRSGVDFHLGSDGVDVQLGSLQSVLAGGVTFGVPDGVDIGKQVKDGDLFKLYETHNAAIQDRFEEKIKYVILLDDSIRGLDEGAPVEYRGLRIGTVLAAPFYQKNFSLKSFSDFKIPVLIAIEPQRRSLGWAHWTPQEWRQHNARFFEHGMRATIKSSNLLTGSMFIDLTFDKHAPKYVAQTVGDFQVFPSEPSQITSFQEQLSDLSDKLNKVDVGKIGDQLKHTLTTTNATLDQLSDVTKSVNELLNKPGTQSLPAQLRDTLQQLQGTLENFQQGGTASQNLNQSLNRLNQVLDDAVPLTRTLRDHPNSLIFGAPDGKDPVPRARK